MVDKNLSCYVGLRCIDGTCPMAWAEEYEERGMDVVRSCRDCPEIPSCASCYFQGDDTCERKPSNLL